MRPNPAAAVDPGHPVSKVPPRTSSVQYTEAPSTSYHRVVTHVSQTRASVRTAGPPRTEGVNGPSNGPVSGDTAGPVNGLAVEVGPEPGPVLTTGPVSGPVTITGPVSGPVTITGLVSSPVSGAR